MLADTLLKLAVGLTATVGSVLATAITPDTGPIARAAAVEV